jgi:hypothetical protein
MRFLKTPTEPIFYDAWMIAHTYLTKNDAEVFLTRKNSDYKIKMLKNQIQICENLIEKRQADFVATHGNKWAWNQLLDGHPRHDKIQPILGAN